MMQGMGAVLQGFRRLENADYVGFAAEVKNGYEEQVYVVDAIDTGRFIRSIDYRAGSQGPDRREFFIDSSSDVLVTYDAFVEAGTKFMAARWPARRSLELLDFTAAADALVEDAFSGFVL